MNKNNRLKAKITNYLYDHEILKKILENSWAFLVCSISALIFAIGFRVFLVPAPLIETDPSVHRLVSGGISGLSQTVIAGIELIPNNFIEAKNSYDIFYSILYFALNVPVIILAWVGIGKRFTIYTLINVAEVSLFTTLLRYADDGFIKTMATFAQNNGGMLSRAVFAGVCTGLSSALCYKIDCSAGGIDIIAYYIALKKSTLVGKYGMAINSGIMFVFAILSATKAGWGTDSWTHFAAALYSLAYMFVVTVVVDAINLRNKKVEVEIVTDIPDLAQLLIANIPHGATVQTGVGAFTGDEKKIIKMVVSSYELNNTVRVIRESDPKAFIKVSELRQVYGRFFLPPIK